MKDKHTQGPWIVAEDQVGDDDGNTIADVTLYNEWNTTEGIVTKEMPWEANARLIAAAPKMKSALKKWLRTIKHLRYCYEFELSEDLQHINNMVANTESLLAKIEGDE